MENSILVTVCYAEPQKQEVIPVSLPAGSKVIDAIKKSGITKVFSSIDLNTNKIGIYGELVKQDSLLSDQDRIEIYRNLLIDPKEARKIRALKRKKEEKN